MYQNGDGIPKDSTKAVDWCTRAANQGEVTAQFNLAMMFAKGDGVRTDLPMAAVPGELLIMPLQASEIIRDNVVAIDMIGDSRRCLVQDCVRAFDRQARRVSDADCIALATNASNQSLNKRMGEWNVGHCLDLRHL